MIQYLPYEKIDKHRWDECIAHSFNGIIYAYSWYLDTVCPGWSALVENDYERVFPITSRKKFGINYLYQPCFSQQLGVFSKNVLNDNKVEHFLESIPKKFKLIEVNLNTYNKANISKFNFLANKTYELDLILSYENLYSNYTENNKRNIKLALRSHLQIIPLDNADALIHIFRTHRGKTLTTLKDIDYEILKRIIQISIFKKKAHILGIQTKTGNLCGGAVFIESNNKIIFLFSAVDKEAKTNGAMSFLIDSFIKQNAQRNLTLDFEGSNNRELARFYRGFGSKECIYYQYRKNELPFILKKSITFIKWIRQKKN
mgnify:CR=1 FL=1